IVVVAAATAAIATTTQHMNVAHHYFDSVTILHVLSLPLAGSQAAFHIHLATLFQILTGNFGKLVEKHQPVPFGAFLALTGILVVPAFAGGKTHIHHWLVVLGVLGFRVLAQVAHEYDLVDPTCHRLVSISSAQTRIVAGSYVSVMPRQV